MAATEYPFSVHRSKELSLDFDESPAIYIQKVLSERNEFQNQNIQLWNIIQKQRIVIQHQQKMLSRFDTSNNSTQSSDAEINAKISELESSKFNRPGDSNLFTQYKDNYKVLGFKNKSQYRYGTQKNETLLSRNASLFDFQTPFLESKNFKPRSDVVLKEYKSDFLEKREMNLDSLKEFGVLRNDKTKRQRSKSEGEKSLSKNQPHSNSIILKSSTVVTQPIESKLVEYNIKRISTVVRKVAESPKQSSSLKLVDSNCEQAINTKMNKIEEKTIVAKSSTVQSKEPDQGKAVYLDKTDALEIDSQNDKQEAILLEKYNSDSSYHDMATSGEHTLNDIDAPEDTNIEESSTRESKVLESSTRENAKLEPLVTDTELDTLENIFILVSGITPKLNLKGKEVLVFRIQVSKLIKNNNSEADFFHECTDSIHSLWVIEKTLSDFSELDNKLRSSGQLSKNTMNKFPDKKAWNTSSPSKLDQRKLMLQNYLQDIIDTNTSVPSIVCDFIASDRAAETTLESPFGQKEGYLIKRGKNFGKWKKRYFLINQSVLEYYDSKNGTKLGEIQLNHVQVAVQHTSSSEYDNDGPSVDTFRHAFMILEPKKSASVMCRHVLCADSDVERDDWVTAIGVHFIEDVSSEQYQSAENELVASTYPESTLSSVSKYNTTGDPEFVPTNSGTSDVFTEVLQEQKAVLGSIPHQCNMNNLNGALNPELKAKGLTSKATISRNFKNDTVKSSSLRVAVSKGGNKDTEYSKPIRRTILWGKKMFKGGLDFGKSKVPQLPVFGVTLQQSVMASRIHEDSTLSSVVYRCIQYLDSKEAQLEEGIYRLSGSSATIRQLKIRFDTEGDYDILDSGIYYDIHAISGLLKLYIRELPTSVLTPEKQNDFLRLTEYTVRRERVRELGKLLSSLPIENYTLLRALINHLITVVEMSEVNKMTLKNVGIVFAPTLGIPAGVFGLLMTEFKYVFFINDDGSAAPQDIPGDEETEKSTCPSNSLLNSSRDPLVKKPNLNEQASTSSSEDINSTHVRTLNSQQKEVSFVSNSKISQPRQSPHFVPYTEGPKRKHVRNSYNFFNHTPSEIIPIEKRVENVLPEIDDVIDEEVFIDSL